MTNPKPSSATSARIPTGAGEFQLIYYPDPADGKEHLAIVYGNIHNQQDVLTRVHSECFTGDVLGSQRCDCGEQLQSAMHQIAQRGSGLIIYLRQEGRGIGLEQKLLAYNLQDQGHDTVDANLLLGHAEDERDYAHAATILRDLDVQSLQLLTNNPSKIDALTAFGIKVSSRVPMVPTITLNNRSYITTKVERMQHLLEVSNGSALSTGGLLVNETTPPYTTLPYTSGVSHRTGNHKASNGSDPHDAFLPQIQHQLAQLSRAANHHFEQTGLPFVTLTYAQSIDGSIAAKTGNQLRLSGPQSMRLTHSLRAQHDAILVGIGTILSDDPSLTTRLADGPSPQPIILDSTLRCPPGARVFEQHQSAIIAIVDHQTRAESSTKPLAKTAKLLPIPPMPNGQVDLGILLQTLGKQGIRSIMVEGGAQVISSFFAAQLVNQLIITIAPTLVGGLAAIGRADNPLPPIYNPIYTQLGDDLIVWGKTA